MPLFYHESCDDLTFILGRKGRFLRDQLGLADQKDEQAQAVVFQLIVQIAQPFVVQFMQILGLIGKQHDPVIALCVGALSQFVQ